MRDNPAELPELEAPPLQAAAPDPHAVLELRHPRQVDASDTVELEVHFAGLGWLPFASAPEDPLPHAGEIRRRLQAGEAGPIAPYVPPHPASPPVPARISFRQLLLAMLELGAITEAEAIAAAETRARPAALERVLAGLAPADRIAARITWATMTEAQRGNPLFAALVAAGETTPAQIDAVFARGATL
jgi:hypothetical protein